MQVKFCSFGKVERQEYDDEAKGGREFKNAKSAKMDNPRNINPVKIKAHTVSMACTKYSILNHPSAM